MTETERLRALLDGRGVEYETDDGEAVKTTSWGFQGHKSALFADYGDGEPALVMSGTGWTAKQAVDAALGRGECEMQATFAKPRPLEGNWQEWTCSECGEFAYIDVMEEGECPRYCPNCGRKAKW